MTALVAVLLVLVAVLALPALAQQPDPDEDDGQGLVPVVPRHGAAQEENRIHLPESRGDELAVKHADAAAARGAWSEAVRGYVAILRAQRDADGGVQSIGKVGDRRYESYGRVVRERLAGLPEEGRRAFRDLCDTEARAELERAVAARDPRGLDAVWRTYPLSSAAPEALERLGDLAFERGDLRLALERWRRAGSLPDAPVDPARLASKIAAAEARRAALRAEAESPSASAQLERWPVVGGDGAHAAPAPAIEAISGPRANFVLPNAGHATQWDRRPHRPSTSSRIFDGGYVPRSLGNDDAFADLVPVADDGRVIVATGNTIGCYDLGGTAGAPFRWNQTVWDKPDQNADLYYSATIAGGRVFASFTRSVKAAQYYRGIPICEALPNRRLVAFDLRTGKRLWDHAESLDPFLRRASVAMPPVARDGVLFAGATVHEGSFKCYLFAVDAATGALLWKRFVGASQMELTMFGEPGREPFAMQPAEEGGVVYYCSGMGTIVAASALTGDIEWVYAYETIPIEPARTYYPVPRDLVWRNGPPVVGEGTLVVAPVDAWSALALDAATGEMRWLLENRKEAVRRLIGIDDGRAVFQGDRLIATDLRTGKRSLEFPKPGDLLGFGDEETGRGLICAGVALVPLPQRIARVDLRRGERLPEMPLPGGMRDSGTLLYIGTNLVTANPQKVSVFQSMVPAIVVPGPAGAR